MSGDDITLKTIDMEVELTVFSNSENFSKKWKKLIPKISSVKYELQIMKLKMQKIDEKSNVNII